MKRKNYGIAHLTSMAAIMMAAVSVPSCNDKDKEDGGSAAQPTSIRVSGFTAPTNPPAGKVQLTVGGWSNVIAEATYAAAGFTLELKDVQESALEAVNSKFPSSLTFSRSDAKVGSASIIATSACNSS